PESSVSCSLSDSACSRGLPRQANRCVTCRRGVRTCLIRSGKSIAAEVYTRCKNSARGIRLFNQPDAGVAGEGAVDARADGAAQSEQAGQVVRIETVDSAFPDRLSQAAEIAQQFSILRVCPVHHREVGIRCPGRDQQYSAGRQHAQQLAQCVQRVLNVTECEATDNPAESAVRKGQGAVPVGAQPGGL